MKITARLEQWDVVQYGLGGLYLLRGSIYDDIKGRYADGTNIKTSYILKTDFRHFRKGFCVKTFNSKYLLGEPLYPTFWRSVFSL